MSSPTRERCLKPNHAAGLQVDNYVATPSASIEAQPPLNGGGRLSRSPTAATAAAGPRRRPRGCCSSSQRLPLATRGVRTRVWGRVVHRLDAGRAQRPPVGAARASEAVALWAFRGAPIASRNSATLTLGHRRYAREYFSDLFCMTCTRPITRPQLETRILHSWKKRRERDKIVVYRGPKRLGVTPHGSTALTEVEKGRAGIRPFAKSGARRIPDPFCAVPAPPPLIWL